MTVKQDTELVITNVGATLLINRNISMEYTILNNVIISKR